MVCKIWGIHGFLGPSWVLITCNICPPGIEFGSFFRLDLHLGRWKCIALIYFSCFVFFWDVIDNLLSEEP